MAPWESEQPVWPDLGCKWKRTANWSLAGERLAVHRREQLLAVEPLAVRRQHQAR